MSLFDEFMADVRTRGPVLRNVMLLFAGLMLLLTLVVGVFYVNAGRGTPPSDALDAERIPAQTYAIGFIEVFQCLREGPQTCTEFEGAKDFLIASIPAEGITYQPLTGSDPGKASGDGVKTFDPTMQTPTPQWKAFGNAATLNGAVATSVVTEDDVTADGDAGVARFPITTKTGQYEGQMSLGSTSDGNLVITKVLYVPAASGGGDE